MSEKSASYLDKLFGLEGRTAVVTGGNRGCSSHLKCKAFKIKSSLFIFIQDKRFVSSERIPLIDTALFGGQTGVFIFSVFHKRFNRYASDQRL